jgi:hypothetical protein
LRESGGDEQIILDELDRAAVLIDQTGAAVYLPLLDDLGASLAGLDAMSGARMAGDASGRRGRAGTPCAG